MFYFCLLPPLMNMSIEIVFMKLTKSFVGEVYKCHLAKSKVLGAVWKHFLYTAKTHLSGIIHINPQPQVSALRSLTTELL